MRTTNLLLAALVADSLALPAHWIYKPKEISDKFGRIDQLTSPLSDSYHSAQSLGGQTHLGHQTLVLARSLSCTSTWEQKHFEDSLREYWTHSDSYQDRATKDFLAKSDSQSTELAGAARVSAVWAHFGLSAPQLVEVAAQQSEVTHGPEVGLEARNFTLLAQSLVTGTPIAEALDSVYSGSIALQQARALKAVEPNEALGKLGRDCSLVSALPSILYLLNRGGSFRQTLIENVMAGGDSAARGLILGPLLYLSSSEPNIAAEWLAPLLARSEVEAL